MRPWSHPILSCEDSLSFEKRHLTSTDAEQEAMERAGRSLGLAIVEELGRRLGEAPRILLLLGKGHNAGDALIATLELLNYKPNARVEVILCFEEKSFAPHVRSYFKSLVSHANVRVFREEFNALKGAVVGCFDLSIDGVFGMQFKPPLRGHFPEFFEWINGLDIGVRVAVDLPSGLSEEGNELVLRADYTFATGILKMPLVEEKNRSYIGRLRYLDIGFFDSAEGDVIDSELRVLAPEILLRERKLRSVVTDKRSYGHLLIVAGSRLMPGAMMMAVEAAIRSGVGLITVLAPESVTGHASTQLPEAMWVPWPETEDGFLALEGVHDLRQFDGKITAVLMGPGLGKGPETQALLDEIIKRFDMPFVVDADAISRARLEMMVSVGRKGVFTPHHGEYRRLADVAADEEVTWEHAQSAFSDCGQTVVLKGPHTCVVHEGGNWISPYGGPVLARGGSGDLLAGLIAGKVANPHYLSILEATCAGVAVHGRAGDKLSSVSDENHLRTTQILDHLNLL
ncbi:MAG: NAD(P)H-hydrate dehydratase [Opitutales bacterium]|nr:NAD(P)H-hydrate dehydratase [Opitutales bacterium]